MAFTPVTALLSFLCLVLSISPAYSDGCKSQTLSKGKFEKCIDLPTLKANLHYTPNAANSSLSIAFVATPAKPTGWVAWGINPKAKGMVGAQALVAHKCPKRGMVVTTYDLVSYSEIKAGPLSFETWNLSAEEANGNFVIYGSLKAKDKSLNQIWQVGAETDMGKPKRHELGADHLGAKSTLAL